MPWQIDPSHTEILFSIRHMMISNVRGSFESFTSQADVDEEHPEKSKLTVEIDVASVNTRDARRDAHLKSADFFDAEKYPKMVFKATGATAIDASRGKLFGDLTIRDITRPVVLDVEYNGQAKSPWGAISAGFTAHTKLDRTDWNLTWNAAIETGGVLVGDTVNVEISVEFTKKD